MPEWATEADLKKVESDLVIYGTAYTYVVEDKKYHIPFSDVHFADEPSNLIVEIPA